MNARPVSGWNIQDVPTGENNIAGLTPSSDRHLPHAIIIGQMKAGTRALLSYMKRHPDVE